MRGRKRWIVSLSRLKKKLIHLLCLPRCVGCRAYLSTSEDVFCHSCLLSYQNLKYRNCSICAEQLCRCDCPNPFLESHFIHRLLKVTRYLPQCEEMPTNRLIYSLKRENRGDVLSFCARELSDAIRAQSIGGEGWIVTNVPRRRAAIVEYGYDHARDLAKAVASACGIPYVALFRSQADKEQKQTHGAERLKNAQVTPRARCADLSGKRLLLIDDIVTTGASMGACAMEAHALGAREVVGACISIAYKDPYTPFRRGDFTYD